MSHDVTVYCVQAFVVWYSGWNLPRAQAAHTLWRYGCSLRGAWVSLPATSAVLLTSSVPGLHTVTAGSWSSNLHRFVVLLRGWCWPAGQLVQEPSCVVDGTVDSSSPASQCKTVCGTHMLVVASDG